MTSFIDSPVFKNEFDLENSYGNTVKIKYMLKEILYTYQKRCSARSKRTNRLLKQTNVAERQATPG